MKAGSVNKSIVIFGASGGPWLLAVPLLLVPDVSAIGYLHSPRLGAITYNLFHNWALGLVVLGCGNYGEAIRLLYPLTISDAVLDEGFALLRDALTPA